MSVRERRTGKWLMAVNNFSRVKNDRRRPRSSRRKRTQCNIIIIIIKTPSDMRARARLRVNRLQHDVQ